MTVQEAIEHCEEKAKEKYTEGMLCHANPNDDLLDECIKCAKEHEQLAEWLKEVEQYRTLGTVEELKEAREKQIAKKVITPPCNACDKELCDCECEHFAVAYRDDYRCPNCDSDGVYMQEYELRFDCCPNCGQALDWSE